MKLSTGTYAVIAVGAVGAFGIAAVGLRRRLRSPRRRTGHTARGMSFSKVGDGSKTILVVPGGPGSEIPSGALGRIMEAGLKQYVAAGYTVWTATRPRNMPPGYSASDMADDYARFIRDEIGAPVDVVLGQSFGGMLSIYLAANHPDVLRHLVLVGSAAAISDWGAAVDGRVAALQAEKRYAAAGALLVESLGDVPKFLALRSVMGRAVGEVLSRADTPLSDLVVEAEAEANCDGRDALAAIGCPVLLVAGSADRFFTLSSVEETASGIRNATVITYTRRGHAGLFTDGRVPSDVCFWLAKRTS